MDHMTVSFLWIGVACLVIPYPFPWQSVVEITTTVTDRYDELDEVVCDLLSSLNKL